MSTLLDRLKVTLRFTDKSISESEKNIQRLKVVKRFLEKQIHDEEAGATTKSVTNTAPAVLDNKRKVKAKRDRGVFNYNGFESPIFTDVLKAIFSDLSKKMSMDEMRENLSSTAIIGTDNPKRRLILSPEEYNNTTPDYKSRYFNQVFTDRDGNQFYLFSEWGRYQETLRKGKKVRVEGNIYKLMRELTRNGISLIQVDGTNYEGRS